MTRTAEPALGVIETASIARGLVVADQMLKRAEVSLLEAHPVSPGKYLIVIGGGEEEVREAMAAGTAAAGDSLLDRLYLANADPQIPGALTGTSSVDAVDAVAVVETATVASTILAADAACKAADVRLCEMRLASGLGGKGFFTMTGELDRIEAAVAAATGAIDARLLVNREILARPHEDLHGTIKG
jgi:microcompartment protein CcmL/EutN